MAFAVDAGVQESGVSGVQSSTSMNQTGAVLPVAVSLQLKKEVDCELELLHIYPAYVASTVWYASDSSVAVCCDRVTR